MDNCVGAANVTFLQLGAGYTRSVGHDAATGADGHR